jgi:hypothetical protein
MKRLSPKLEQLVIAFGLGGAFLMMASIFAPDFTRAETGAGPGDEAAHSSGDAHAGLKSLGSIEDERYIVRIYGGADGPLYSVYDAIDGTELGVLLTAEKAAEWFPELPIPNMDFGTGSPVMMAEPLYIHDY